MLKKLLDPKECAACRICCTFDDEDLWETPVVYNNQVTGVREQTNAEFIDCGEYKLFSLDKSDDGIYYCTALDKSSGCKLSPELKPFDCKIWPFRVMRIKGFDRTVITLSPVCPVVKTKPLADIMNVVSEISDEIFEQATAHPYMVKDYIEGYPILAVENTIRNS